MINFDEYESSPFCLDQYLFHYTKKHIGLDFIIRNRRLKFSAGKKSHDPLESDRLVHTYSIPSANSENGESFEEFSKYADYENEISRLRSQLKFASFCVDREICENHPWDKAAFRSRMWSQYAQQHKGICIIFNRSKLEAMTKAYSESIGSKFFASQRITYENEILRKMDSALEIRGNDIDENPNKRFTRFANVYAFTKIKDYENESEYRIAYQSPQTEEFELVEFDDAIEGVLLGHSIEWNETIRLTRKIEKLGIPTKYVQWLSGKPFLGHP